MSAAAYDLVSDGNTAIRRGIHVLRAAYAYVNEHIKGAEHCGALLDIIESAADIIESGCQSLDESESELIDLKLKQSEKADAAGVAPVAGKVARKRKRVRS